MAAPGFAVRLTVGPEMNRYGDLPALLLVVLPTSVVVPLVAVIYELPPLYSMPHSPVLRPLRVMLPAVVKVPPLRFKPELPPPVVAVLPPMVMLPAPLAERLLTPVMLSPTPPVATDEMVPIPVPTERATPLLIVAPVELKVKLLFVSVMLLAKVRAPVVFVFQTFPVPLMALLRVPLGTL